MTQFSYRLALSSMLLATSVALWWASGAAASRYLPAAGTGGSQTPADAVANGGGGAGFDWFDAGIGAATTLGLALVAGGACVLVLRHRRNAAFS